MTMPASANADDFQKNTGIRPSDPQMTGPRDPNYDYLIVPGERAGPVALSGLVSKAIQHLGQPDRVDRSTFRGPGYSSDEVYYHYKSECISFTWTDSGLSPKIENGWRGINVKCPKWQTSEGIRVGMNLQEAGQRVNGAYCLKGEGNEVVFAQKSGIWLWAKDRNSPITTISVIPSSTSWNGMCKDD